MPYKNKIIGIYSIQTPKGNTYVGSSINIRHRWVEHRSWLKHGKPHSKRLQTAYDKYLDKLEFKILEECQESDLQAREQFYIDTLKASLNTSEYVKNVWLSPDTREKFRKIHQSEEWKKLRSEIGKRNKSRWVRTDCSDGTSYENFAAGRKFGVSASHIKLLTKNQSLGKLGVRFKLSSDEWLAPRSPSQVIKDAIKKSGYSHSEETKNKMKIAAVGRSPTAYAMAKSIEATSKRVIGKSLEGLTVIDFFSMRDAARYVNPERYRTATAQICKAISGVKKSAYGYTWEYAA